MIQKLKMLCVLVTVSIAAVVAHADTIKLADGRVLEGEITRDLDGFVWFKYEIAGVAREEMFAPEDYTELLRGAALGEATDAEAGTSPAAPIEPIKANAPAKAETKAKRRVSPGAPRGAVISLGDGGSKDMIGLYITAKSLGDLIPILEEDEIDIVVLKVNSGGGAVLEIDPLTQMVHEEFKTRFRTVGWIESAISGGAMGLHSLEEIYFMPEGNYGACTMWRGDGDAAEGGSLEVVLYQMEKVSQLGQHDYRIMRSMQVTDPLSVDFNDDTGEIVFRQDEDGEYLVNPEGRILTFNSVTAEKVGFSQGTAATVEELTEAMGYREIDWVGEYDATVPYPVSRAEEAMIEFRDRTFRDQTRFNEYVTIFNTAMGNIANDPAFATRARKALNDMRRMVRNNPRFALFNFNMTEEQFQQWFRDQEDAIREALRR